MTGRDDRLMYFLSRDEELMGILSKDEPTQLFTVDPMAYHTKRIGTIFKRVFDEA